jgi:hypothetical protein
MEEEKNERFLPIGSVVLLKGGKKEVMIMSYCIMPSGKVYSPNGKLEKKGLMFDYGGCLYPEGMIKSDQLFAFNHDQIEKVCFKGYVTDQYSNISNLMNEKFDDLKKQAAEIGNQEQATNA